MNEPGSLTAAFRVESLEWSHHAGGAMLRVQGRWRRRRPGGVGPPQLVLARDDRRLRFPAMPEPPGLSGAEPGAWQMSFAVPAAAVPRAGDRAWLQVGAVLIPLPVEVGDEPAPPLAAVAPIAPAAPSPPAREPVPPAVLTERRLHAAELALEAAHARAVAAERRHTELESEGRRLAAELENARRALAAGERIRRVAEQREHAERAERLALQHELTALSRRHPPPDGRVAAMLERIGELEQELESLERRLVEAEQLREAAQVARRRAEGELARRPAGAAVIGAATVLAGEAILARARPPVAVPRRPAGAIAPAPSPAVPELLRERRMLLARSAARRRAGAPPGRMREILDGIGAELGVLRTALGQAHAARSEAQARAEAAERELRSSRRRTAGAYAALGELRADLAAAGAAVRGLPERPVPAVPGLSERPGGAPRTGPVPDLAALRPGTGPLPFDTGRLDAARSRLRTARSDPEPAAGSAWIRRALRSLGADDPVAAGRLVLALLPVHALGGDGPVRYDLVLRDAGVVCVDVPGAGGAVTVTPAERPRAATAIDFAFHGDLAALARFAVAGAMGRWPRGRGRRGRGRIMGVRAAAGSLGGLVGARVRWRALLAGGVELDPWLALSLAARAIDPAQTRGEHFAIEFSDPAGGPRLLLQIADGRRPAVAQAPFSAPAGSTEVRLPAAELGPLLAGVPGAAAQVTGDPRSLERVQGWIELAQSG